MYRERLPELVLQENLLSPETDLTGRDYDLSAVIVNYNGGEVLSRCLEALRSAAGALRVETIVVDNGSTDGSTGAGCVGESAKVVRLGRNRGFASANNIGISHATGRHFLLLNSDCFLREGALEALGSRLEGDPRAAVVGPRLLNADGTLQPSCHNFPSPLVFFLEQSMLWRLLRHVPGLRGQLSIASRHDAPATVDWLLGACMLVRREALEESGGFDSRFFFYWEEADLCMRLKKFGWHVDFEPSAEAVHLGGASSTDPFLILHFFRSLRLFYRKHFTARQRETLRVMVRAMAIVKAARLFVERTVSGNSEARRAELARHARAWLAVAGFGRVNSEK